MSKLTDFFAINTGNFPALLKMIEDGVGTPNDVFPVDAVLRLAPEVFTDDDPVVKAGATLMHVVLHLLTNHSIYAESISNKHLIINRLYELGAKRNDSISLKISLKDVEFFIHGCSLPNLEVKIARFLEIGAKLNILNNTKKQQRGLKPLCALFQNAQTRDLNYIKILKQVRKSRRLAACLGLLRARIIPETSLPQNFYTRLHEIYDQGELITIRQSLLQLLDLHNFEAMTVQPQHRFMFRALQLAFDGLPMVLVNYGGFEVFNLMLPSINLRIIELIKTGSLEINAETLAFDQITEPQHLIQLLVLCLELQEQNTNPDILKSIMGLLHDCPVFNSIGMQHSVFLSLYVAINGLTEFGNGLHEMMFKYCTPHILNTELAYPLLHSKKQAKNILQVICETSFYGFTSGVSNKLYSELGWQMRKTDIDPFANLNRTLSELDEDQMKEQMRANLSTGSVGLLGKAIVFQRVLGRTLLLEGPAGYLIAVKFQKVDEDAGILAKQELTEQFLRARRTEFDLLGEVPIAGEIISVTTLEQVLDQFQVPAEGRVSLVENVGKHKDSFKAYVYQATPDYFVYLSAAELSSSEFCAAALNSVADLLTLLEQHGMIFNQLADLYHNKSETRAYLTQIPMPGKLADWQGSVRYPNLRKSTGLADSGDWCVLRDFQIRDPHQDTHYVSLLQEYIGQILLVIELCGAAGVIKSFEAAQLSQAQKDEKWLELAKALRHIHRYTFKRVCTMLGVSMPDYIFAQAFNHYPHLAKQLSFWCDSSRHYAFLVRGQIPPGMYPESTHTDFADDAPNDIDRRLILGQITSDNGIYGDHHGKPVNDGGRHLGFYNGLNPVDDRARQLPNVLPALLFSSFEQASRGYMAAATSMRKHDYPNAIQHCEEAGKHHWHHLLGSEVRKTIFYTYGVQDEITQHKTKNLAAKTIQAQFKLKYS